MGHKSYKFTQRLIEGKKVRLEFDQQKYDEYHRVLAYVYLTNGVFVNAEIVKSGYAYAYAIKPNLRYSKMLGKLYVDAREDRRGLWQNSAYRSKSIKRFSAK
jgi:micrococcal nuclease